MINRKLTITTGVGFTLLFLGCLGKDKEKDCWLERNKRSALCIEESYTCYLSTVDGPNVDSDAWDACYDEAVACADSNQEQVIECAGEDSCVAQYAFCIDGCAEDWCWDECRDDLADCASWWDRDCEDDCGDEVAACGALAEAAWEASDRRNTEDYVYDIGECNEDYYESCIPGCYEEE